MASCSKSKKFLTLKQKVDVIKEVELGKKPSEVAESFGMSRSEVYKILKMKETVADSFKDCTVQKSSKIMTRKSKHADIDQAVLYSHSEWDSTPAASYQISYPSSCHV